MLKVNDLSKISAINLDIFKAMEELKEIDDGYVERFKSVRTRQNLKSAIDHLKIATERLIDIKEITNEDLL